MFSLPPNLYEVLGYSLRFLALSFKTVICLDSRQLSFNYYNPPEVFLLFTLHYAKNMKWEWYLWAHPQRHQICWLLINLEWRTQSWRKQKKKNKTTARFFHSNGTRTEQEWKFHDFLVFSMSLFTQFLRYFHSALPCTHPLTARNHIHLYAHTKIPEEAKNWWCWHMRF